MVGKSLGHYIIENRIGAGSWGEVFRAYDSRLHRPVAIKVLWESVRKGTGREQIIAEARAASALNHPNICTVYEVGEGQGHGYIVMELVEGRVLSQIIPSEGLPVETCIRYSVRLADALAHAHERGVSHGDLNSNNIIVSHEGRLKILDFGLGQRLGTASGDEMPREGHDRERVRIERDLRDFGVILHRMATGQDADRNGMTEPDLVTVAPGLRTTIRRCLRAGFEGGYTQTREIVEDLQREVSPSTSLSIRLSAPRLSRRAKFGLAFVFVIASVCVMLGIAHYWRVTSAMPARAGHLLAPGNPIVKVWVNLPTKVYHCPGTRWYGTTKVGAFMTQREAQQRGYKAAFGRPCQ